MDNNLNWTFSPAWLKALPFSKEYRPEVARERARVAELQKRRSPVGYISDHLDNLSGLIVADPEERTSAQTQQLYKKELLETVYQCLVALTEHDQHEWPVALMPLTQYATVDSLEGLTYLADVQREPVTFLEFGLTIPMAEVPVFLEWFYDTGRACRLLWCRESDTFLAMHLRYEAHEDGNYYPTVGQAMVTGLFAFSREDVKRAGRLRTLAAAFAPLEVDEEGEVPQESYERHTLFSIWELCH